MSLGSAGRANRSQWGAVNGWHDKPQKCRLGPTAPMATPDILRRLTEVSEPCRVLPARVGGALSGVLVSGGAGASPRQPGDPLVTTVCKGRSMGHDSPLTGRQNSATRHSCAGLEIKRCEVTVDGRPQAPVRRPLSELHLDRANPRLPLDVRGRSEEDLEVFIERHYDALNVAQSIALHGFFESDPLVIVEEEGRDVVVEGNRRLVALRGLADEASRQRFPRPAEWERLASMARERGTLPPTIPVVVAPTRLAVAPMIGYRHITGILPWDPYSQARYVAHLVDDNQLTFEGVSELLGESLTVIRSRYRNYGLVEQARRAGVEVSAAESDFGVLTRALQSQGVREFIGAPEPAGTQAGVDPVPPEGMTRVERVLGWLYGDSEGVGRAISESRDIPQLARVLASPTGREVLEETGDLSGAAEAIGGSLERLKSRLASAVRALQAARGDIDSHREDDGVQSLLAQASDALADLRAPK